MTSTLTTHIKNRIQYLKGKIDAYKQVYDWLEGTETRWLADLNEVILETNAVIEELEDLI